MSIVPEVTHEARWRALEWRRVFSKKKPFKGLRLCEGIEVLTFGTFWNPSLKISNNSRKNGADKLKVGFSTGFLGVNKKCGLSE